MQIGEVIRKHRKSLHMTQDEMAKRLGVTAPAVNKWENGNSLPDIMLLAPIARLLHITLETLLSFQEELTIEEVHSFIKEVNTRLKNETYEDVFQWAKKKIELNPNCEYLILWIAQIFDAQRYIMGIQNPESYDGYISDCYIRVLNSSKEDISSAAADSLFSFYFRKEQYEKAEEYLAYFSKQNPERKRKQATIYSKTNRLEEAYKSYEELLLSGYNMMNLVFYGIYRLAMQENDMKKAHFIVDKQKQLASLFEMGEYYEISLELELAVQEKDIDMTITMMERMLASTEKITAFCKSPLYEHMTFKEVEKGFQKETKASLLKHFRDEETFGFLKNDKRWIELVKN